MIVLREGLARLEPYWQRSTVWWSARTRREQLLLGALAALAILAFLVVAIIGPLAVMREEARADLRDAALLEARLRTAGPNLALQGTIRRGSASAILTDSAAAAGVAIQRIEPEGGNTRVVLTDAPFEQVMTWIAGIEQTSRLRIVDARVERKGAAGLVAATIMVSG